MGDRYNIRKEQDEAERYRVEAPWLVRFAKMLVAYLIGGAVFVILAYASWKGRIF